MAKESPRIIIYTKTYCGWCEEIRVLLKKNQLEYEEKDIMKNEAFIWELKQKSQQELVPSADVGGAVFAPVTAAELEEWLKEQGYAD